MISVEQAKNIITSQQPDWGTCHVPTERSIGEVLAEEIYADRDFPPYDRVTMDGVALRFDTYESGIREFQVQETQLAGELVKHLRTEDHVIEIMTGAVLSQGCDTVVRYEDVEFFEKGEDKWVRILLPSVKRFQHIHVQGSDEKKGNVLVEKGTVITAAEIAILATVGCHQVQVYRKPKVAIVSTGDELVDVSETPLPHQIRKSNVVVMEACLRQLRVPTQLFHWSDDKQQMKEQLDSVLHEFDVILLSGAVSKGKADYLPEILHELQVEKLFHTVAQRPGKPFWFGTHPRGVQVFAFPGNPVSTYMCFRVYFLPWLMSLVGKKQRLHTAVLAMPFSFKPSLGYFLQVRSLVREDHMIYAYPQMGNGSGDLANLTKSDAFLYLPTGKEHYEAGQSYEYYSYDVSSWW